MCSPMRCAALSEKISKRAMFDDWGLEHSRRKKKIWVIVPCDVSIGALGAREELPKESAYQLPWQCFCEDICHLVT